MLLTRSEDSRVPWPHFSGTGAHHEDLFPKFGVLVAPRFRVCAQPRCKKGMSTTDWSGMMISRAVTVGPTLIAVPALSVAAWPCELSHGDSAQLSDRL